MPDAIIDFSAQFGGRDAAQQVLPHVKALKSASVDVLIIDFPFDKLAFILRVDGSVNSYGLSGVGNLDVYGSEYLSLDIGIPADVAQHADDLITQHISTALEASAGLLASHPINRTKSLPHPAIEMALNELVKNYDRAL